MAKCFVCLNSRRNGSTCAAASAIDSWSWRNYLCDTPLKFVCNRSVGRSGTAYSYFPPCIFPL